MSDWFTIESPELLPTPALVVYPERIRENIRRMIAIAGSPDRLRPHIKTHKMSAIVRMQMDAGIKRFKCATLSEAAMLGRCAAPDVLLAYQPVGPNIKLLWQLVERFPATRFSTIVDDARIISQLSDAFAGAAGPLGVLLDVDNGMQRTGVPVASADCESLCSRIANCPGLTFAGLHVYDGHIHDADLAERTFHCERDFQFAQELIARLQRRDLPVEQVVVGGTITFPIHSIHVDRQCSPGTCLLWDAGYGQRYEDLGYLPAAALISRVTSANGTRICLDLGHKALAADPSGPRVQWLTLPNAEMVMHNEEHMVMQTNGAAKIAVGDLHYALPIHICPTVALHSHVWACEAGKIVDRWPVDARDRLIEIAN